MSRKRTSDEARRRDDAATRAVYKNKLSRVARLSFRHSRLRRRRGRSPLSPRQRNTRTSRHSHVPTVPHARSPDRSADGRENSVSRASRASRAQPGKRKYTPRKEQNTKRLVPTPRKPEVCPDARERSHRDRRVGYVDVAGRRTRLSEGRRVQKCWMQKLWVGI